MKDSTDKVQLCDACGKPQRRSSQTGNPLPLKRCSRCRQTSYHDAECQKLHYPKHKKDCRKHQLADENRNLSVREIIRVQASTDRGNCMIAVKPIQRGKRITTSSVDSPHWEAFVAPVLLEGQRWARCALCFAKLEARPLRFESNPWFGNQHPYPILFCSHDCRTTSQNLGFEREEAVVLKLYQGQRRGPPKIFATAILLYRLLCNNSKVLEELKSLQGALPKGTSPSEESQHHSQAVIATVLAMTKIPSDVDLNAMINRIKINGFTIADGESIALGVGVYSTPSFMNHSCQPNAIQTFIFGQDHLPPRLLLTAHKSISAGEEILISYIDNSTPVHMRHQQLLENYFFVCQCLACQDQEREAAILGIRCCHCENSNQPLRIVKQVAPSPWSLHCPLCSASDFESIMHRLKAIEKTLDPAESNLAQLWQRYQDVQRTCFPTSWYVQESGDQLVHGLLNKVGQSSNDREQKEFSKQALDLLADLYEKKGILKANGRVWWSTSFEFRCAIHHFQEAKLRLFLYPDPAVAIQLLNEAHSILSLYYPNDHELMRDLKTTMQSAILV